MCMLLGGSARCRQTATSHSAVCAMTHRILLCLLSAIMRLAAGTASTLGHILNFLRDGQVVLPAAEEELRELRAQAEFYNLVELAQAIDAQLVAAEQARTMVDRERAAEKAEEQRGRAAERDAAERARNAAERARVAAATIRPDILWKNRLEHALRYLEGVEGRFSGAGQTEVVIQAQAQLLKALDLEMRYK